MNRVFLACSLSLITASGVWAGQSLVEIAKKEEARRKEVKAPAKVYTNADLKRDPSKAPPSVPPAELPVPPAPSTQVPALTLSGGKPEAQPPPKEVQPPRKDEAYWRDRIGAARAALERSRVLVDAVQSRLNALATDIVNRDDPAQRAQLELERQRATLELARLNEEIAEQTKNIAEIEEEARKAGVPPGWLR